VSELRTIARHAGTLLVGQLAVMAFGVTDTIVAGRYSEQALAALSVGSAVYVSIFVGLMGVLQALLPTWAELNGAGRAPEVGRSVRQALYLSALTMVVGVTALFFPGPLLEWTQVPPSLQGQVRDYLSVLTLALPAALLFRMYSTLNQSLGKPLLVTWLQTGSLLVKIPLSIWFAFGGLGLEPRGAVGCAWATVVVNWLFILLALWLIRTQPLYRPYAIWRRIEPPNWRVIGQFARLGLPGGLAIMVEVTSFTLMALFIARQGTLASAAHQVVSNLAAVLFMTPLSIAIATSARVSYWLGAGDQRLARSTIRTGFKMAFAMSLLLSATTLLGRHGIAGVYAKTPEVAALAATLLAWLALFHLGDAAQAVLVWVLRCYRVVLAPLVAYCVLLWGVGLWGGYLLAYHGIGPLAPHPSPLAFWQASTLALLLLAPILLTILWRAVRRAAPAA
jgi:MATE family multidrug resistance protein